MFDRLIRELERLNGQKISIPIKADAEGYIDRECPNKECLFVFKVNESDWSKLFKDEAVFCPMCGHEAPADSYFTTEQLKKGEEQGSKYIQGIIDNALVEDAYEFNRGQDRNAFISMSMTVTGTVPHHVIVPISAIKVFESKFKCEVCNANYAVIGSAFFCPCCGHNSVEKTFDDSLNKVEIKLQNIPVIRKAIELQSKDQAEITCRSIIETGINDCVVAFQRFCEARYKQLTPTEKLPVNVFQRIEDGNELWKKVLKVGYIDWLNKDEYMRLNILFQRRHLLAHTEGIVDEKYLQRTPDTTYKLNQRIVVKEKDVHELLKLIKKIVSEIRNSNR